MSRNWENGNYLAVFEEEQKKYATMLSGLSGAEFNVLRERISDNPLPSDWQALAVQKEHKKRREETNS